MKKRVLRQLILLSKRLLYGFLAQLFFCSFLLANPGNAQRKTIDEVNITINLHKQPIKRIFKQIESNTEFHFTYNDELLDIDQLVTVTEKNQSLYKVLESIAKQTRLSFVQVNENIHVKANTSLTGKEAVSVKDEQDVTITGTVKDQTGAPLPGVTVAIAGTSTGTVTDLGGKYSLTVPEGSTLTYSFVGFETQRISIDSRSVIDVTLLETVSSLEEVVVIGYGAVKKIDLTGSVSQVKSEDLEAIPVYNVEQALKARAAGVQVTQNSGQPGDRIEVRVRGGNSMIGDNQPLYVVDGFPITGGINFLNPADIESIDILKDASATAIYGARGANGVVIITSKRGKAGQKSKIEVSSYYGVQQETNRYDLLDAREYAIIANEWLKNGGQEPFFNPEEIEGPGTDWQDAVFQTAPIQDYTISFSGSSDKTRYAFSGNYYDQKGIIINTGAKRGLARLNLDHELSKRIKMAVNMNLSRRQQIRVPVNNGYRGTSVLSAAASAPPTLPVYDENGLPTQIEKFYNFGSADMRNPMIFAQQQTRILANTIVGNTSFNIKLTDELSFKTLLGLEYGYSANDYYEPIIFENDRGYGSQSNSYYNSFLNENILTYSKNWNDKHQLTLMGGYTYQTRMDRNFGLSVSGFSTNVTENYNLAAAETINPPSSGYSEWVLASWLTRANYSLNDKYLFTASMRADGSSRFGNNNKWAVFPSVAFAWRLSEEGFMKNQNLIDELKLRSSYGVTGNTALSPYQSLDRIGSVRAIYANQAEEIGYVPLGIANPNLKWETTAQFDVGIDLGILDNRLRFTVDYYRKRTTDLLASVPLPPSVGFGAILQNIGEIENKGVEFTVDADILSRAVTWNVSASISANKNKVIRIAGGSDILSAEQFSVWSSTNIAREGRPLGSFYGYLEDGLDENGFIKYRDLNEDGLVNAADRTILGNPNPDFFYGFNSNLSWKNLELSLFLEGVHGNQIFNATNGTHLNSFQRGNNQFRDIIGNYWTSENPDPNAQYPKISSATGVDISDRFIENGSYLRVKSLKLAYNLPIREMGISWLGMAQIYFSGINLLTFTNYTGLDPEINTRGVDSQNISQRLRMGHDQSGYPNFKTYALGLKLNF